MVSVEVDLPVGSGLQERHHRLDCADSVARCHFRRLAGRPAGRAGTGCLADRQCHGVRPRRAGVKWRGSRGGRHRVCIQPLVRQRLLHRRECGIHGQLGHPFKSYGETTADPPGGSDVEPLSRLPERRHDHASFGYSPRRIPAGDRRGARSGRLRCGIHGGRFQRPLGCQ